ncbi:hypothetical protein [Algibacter mikhailovii]|uniref:Uncharacterized protein n=2 Tax=Algibacter mikhailovii TaxID=425498 RepID=A0A918R0W9_9FLAO|nr:hypothetical protein [Algibacter mikhailovii]GGZ79899.1 hypothetical protein GCM10007028_16870 [Algibacter mikhailovii]
MKNKNNNLKHVIVDFRKLTPEILDLLVKRYPDGYDESQIITFRNHHDEIIEAVEVTTLDTMYLVKVSSKLALTMKNYDVESFDSLNEDINQEINPENPENNN